MLTSTTSRFESVGFNDVLGPLGLELYTPNGVLGVARHKARLGVLEEWPSGSKKPFKGPRPGWESFWNQRKIKISSLLHGREGGGWVTNFPTGKSKMFLRSNNRERVSLGSRPAGGHGKNPPNGLAVRVIACKYRKVSDSTIVISINICWLHQMFGLVMSGVHLSFSMFNTFFQNFLHLFYQLSTLY